MPISLQGFTTGDTNYLAKHNANVDALEAFLNSVETSLANVTGGGSGLANSGNIGKATYGTSGIFLVGSGSFAYSTNTNTMTLDPGFCWDSSLGIMHYQSGSTEVSFAGWLSGTYYIRFNGASTPYIDTISTGAIYSVAWSGASFGAITLLASVTPSAPDIGDMADSTYSGLSYLTPADRLIATEKAFSQFLVASMVNNYAPSATDFMEAIGIRMTGALTTTTTLTVPALDKVILVRNETTTANGSGVTIKTAAGTGVTLLAGEHAALFCDGTDVLSILRQGAAVTVNSLVDLDDTPATLTGNSLKLLRVREDETSTEFIDPAALVVPALVVKDETIEVDPAVVGLNFEGAGVTAEQVSPGQIKITIPGGDASALSVQDEGIAVDSSVVLINFEGAGVTVTQTAAGQVLVTIPGPTGGPVDYDVAFYIADKRPAGAIAFRHTFTKAVDFAANFALSDSDAVAAATSSAVFLIKKNGTQVGTLTFAAAGTVGTFASTGGVSVSFLAGDILEIVAPDPQDATLSGVSITMAGVRA